MVVSSLHFATACDRKDDYRFLRKNCGLTKVPKIPAAVKDVQLDGNLITDIIDEALSHLDQCKELSLSENKLSSIRYAMFKGLKSLDTLDLKDNIISSTESGSFRDLPQLTEVRLDDNQLTTLDNPFSKPSSGYIALYLSDNPLQCDTKLCWLKDAERDGWVLLKDPKPTCQNYPNARWDDVNLNCSLGELTFSIEFFRNTRSWQNWQFCMASNVNDFQTAAN